MTLVVLNGERRELPEGATVESAVRDAGVAETCRGVAVAVDGEVVPRGEWARTEVREGQRVEVVHAVQGG
jgi:sulfur carrier protein